ncbi:MAG: outer membrane lipid asymmetry maintenance protein MlaD [Gammaproteobacteria bacterium]|jgi:phospholipid/cholesterol/gamma-HCH transport system substrate-binding protein
MGQRQTEIIIGFFILIGFAAIAILAVQVSNISESAERETYSVTAHFDNIGGLRVKSPVKMGGVLIGRISDIRLDKKTLSPVVTMAIFSEYNELPTETSASILTAGLLGEQFMSLSPGGDDLFLMDGDRIYDTQSALVIEELIGKFLFNESNDL